MGKPPFQYDDIVSYLNAAQSPFHCCEEVKRRLLAAGFVELDERRPWAGAIKPGFSYVVTRNGSTLLAFSVGGKFDASTSGAICVGAHTDSPVPKLKPVSRLEKSGATMLGVVGYGGGLWHTWFDRDLTLVGRAVVRRGGRVAPALVDVKRPVCRIPTLAIHLSQGDERTTFKPNLQQHLPPMLVSGVRAALRPKEAADKPGALARHDAAVLALAAEALGCPAEDVLELELQLADAQPAQLVGLEGEFVASGRLDNQASCYCGTQALIEALGTLPGDASLRVLAMFDHEEVGSLSAQGADSPCFGDCLERAYGALAPAGDFHAFLARSFQISSDMAHGQHPNYADRHDPQHAVQLQGGLVIKHNANQRYATNAVGAAYVREFARLADVPVQDFAVKADSGCGTTIGPITAAGTGIRTVDVGPPQLSMHSCREMMGLDDVYYSVKTFRAAYEHYAETCKAVDVDGPDVFWKSPGSGWAVAKASC
mmetsp:Transcript_1410/g.4224  ORF Transcript_1410/g.4224 Transcript_1410/m.4224 type:complete len:483 (-) Transcript_1410:40-1488(-)|eukprot:CAMPEP_0119273772 /NCGR_PEP_ID=MMETSP1329-20130426/10945_1 /TAXON_ID=114041 /ORGANISM="Genus nov. species nov., Strain RCC1024" /LENGTH=482 /DNA_ID=CAMNT_0007274013 /DNA_START=190 /DNA_END=1638 /DNA_ORIENTATION=+